MENSQIVMNTMEVLATKPISELVTEATIKVCYVSNEPNRNETVITEEVGREIAASLPGAPVVGLYNEETGDFETHSRRVTFKNGEFVLEDLTKPYGFVSPVDAPWYQDFEEGGQTRKYLMCKAFLWTRQYEEAGKALDKGQSMELDERAMSGYYQGDVFVFTSATLDKLCILGDAYEPCFEGAGILSTYAKQYKSLAEELEETLGRRYYVVNDKLVKNEPEVKAPFPLSYAVELGWNLTDAIYQQLSARGAESEYRIEGIYAESDEIFVVLQDVATLEFVRSAIVITGENTVELGVQMVKVVQAWIEKDPQNLEDKLENNKITVEPDLSIEENNDTQAKFSLDEGAKAEEAEVKTEEVAVVEESNETDEEQANKIASLENEVAQKDAEIAELKAALAEHEAKEKEEIVSSYSELLTQDEMKDVVDNLNQFSLEEVESKLAVLYARKAKQAPQQPSANYQVNIQTIADESTPTNLPDFMKRALEYDKSRLV